MHLKVRKRDFTMIFYTLSDPPHLQLRTRSLGGGRGFLNGGGAGGGARFVPVACVGFGRFTAGCSGADAERRSHPTWPPCVRR